VKIVSLMQQIREGGFFGYWEAKDDFIFELSTKSTFAKLDLEAIPFPLKRKIKHVF